MTFRDDFIWAAAAASYQIEGGWQADGKGLSVWDNFSHTPGKTFEGHTGDVACDHYHRFKEDIALWKSIGIKAYRLSISWPRVMPDGTGAVNAKGMDFYSRLIDELLKNDITPFVTLFHWDYPYELYCRGGWLNPDSSDWFGEYAGHVADALSDRVQYWMTLNEPQVFVTMGHGTGRHAPGLQLPRNQLARITHNVLLSHGKAVQAIRGKAKSTPMVGLAPVGRVKFPENDDPELIEAARQATFAPFEDVFFGNICWMDPIFLGKYNSDQLEVLGEDAPQIQTNDEKTIGQPLDFYGTNFYRGACVRLGADGKAENVPHPVQYDMTAIRWDVTPEILYWGPKFLYERYGKPIYITENGLSSLDWVSQDGKVHDPQRIEFLTRYLSNLKRAAGDGVDIRGYFQWSIMDNYEWAEGYKERFGLIYVDFETQQRILKDSAYWYRDLIASNGETLPTKLRQG